MGWLSARRRMRTEGLLGLGDLLAPRIGRLQFASGFMAGLWRVHTLDLSLAGLTFAPAVLAVLPAGAVQLLFAPLAGMLSGPNQRALSLLVPGLVIALSAVLLAANFLLTLRLLAESGPRYPLGLVFRAVGAAWRVSLGEATTLLGLGIAILAGAAVACAFIGGSYWLAGALELGAGIAIAGYLAVTVEAFLAWVEAVHADPLEDYQAYSFSAWLAAQLLRARVLILKLGFERAALLGLIALGTLASAWSIAAGRGMLSWLGLGWYGSTAGLVVLAMLRKRDRP
jgi:hypothetical protein